MKLHYLPCLISKMPLFILLLASNYQANAATIATTTTTAKSHPPAAVTNNNNNNNNKAPIVTALHRRLPLGRFHPDANKAEEHDAAILDDLSEDDGKDEEDDFLDDYDDIEDEDEDEEDTDEEEEELDATMRDLQKDKTKRKKWLPRKERKKKKKARTLEETCNIVMNAYLGKTGVERLACTTCYRDPENYKQFVIECDFAPLCQFCSPESDVCYNLTHEYKVKPWKGRLRRSEDISYSACGIMADSGAKVCLDETYENWGYLATQCVSVDDVSCQNCDINPECDEYRYDCDNIEPDFFMDSCDYSINDNIPKDSIFIGFNYAVYADDTDSCFADDDGTPPGNLNDRKTRGLLRSAGS